MSDSTATTQGQAAKPPEGIKAGDGRYFFELAKVNHIEAGPEYSTANGSLVSGERIMCGLMHMPRGTGARPHSHPNEQWIYVVEGTLDMEVAGVKSKVPPGMLAYIPANTVHRAVATTERDVVFFTAKDMSHGIWGSPVDKSRYGAHFDPGYEPKK